MKTHKTAVVIIPPEKLWTQIQEIRRKYDRQFRRWMPHINLIYPFRPVDEFEKIYSKFESVCKEINSFEITLAEFKYFHHGGERFTLWLSPEPREKVVELQSKIQTLVPDCDDVRRFENGFTPHLSVGQVRGEEMLRNLIDELQKKWTPIAFTLKEIYFIWRNEPPDDVFKIWREIKLGE